MSLVLQLLMNGLIAGAIYALVASGFSLIYSTNKFVHFAHGSAVAVSAYFLYLLFSMLGLEFFLSIFLVVLFAGAFGLLMDKAVYSQLRKRKASGLILLIARALLKVRVFVCKGAFLCPNSV